MLLMSHPFRTRPESRTSLLDPQARPVFEVYSTVSSRQRLVRASYTPT